MIEKVIHFLAGKTVCWSKSIFNPKSFMKNRQINTHCTPHFYTGTASPREQLLCITVGAMPGKGQFHCSPERQMQSPQSTRTTVRGKIQHKFHTSLLCSYDTQLASEYSQVHFEHYLPTKSHHLLCRKQRRYWRSVLSGTSWFAVSD